MKRLIIAMAFAFACVGCFAFNTNRPTKITISGASFNTNRATNISVGSGFQNLFDTNTTAFALRADIGNRERVAVDALVRQLKAANLWTNFYALYPFVGTTSNSMACNLITNQYNITWHGTNTYGFYGVTGDGVSGYGDTGFNPITVGVKTNDFHMYVWQSGRSAATGTSMGADIFGTTIRASKIVYNDQETVVEGDYTNASFYITLQNNSTYDSVANRGSSDVSGECLPGSILGTCNVLRQLLCFSGTSSVHITSTNSVQGTNQYLANTNLWVLAAANGGTGPAEFRPSNANFRAAAIGRGLTFTQATNYLQIMNRFQTALKRNTTF